MRAEPPRPPRRHRADSDPDARRAAAPRRRCPYLEQILRDRSGPFGWLTRYKADCHVDRRTHVFRGRHPSPPCITAPETCALYRSEHDEEDRRISRWRD